MKLRRRRCLPVNTHTFHIDDFEPVNYPVHIIDTNKKTHRMKKKETFPKKEDDKMEMEKISSSVKRSRCSDNEIENKMECENTKQEKKKLSEFELQRQEKMARNAEMMQSLGFSKLKAKISEPRTMPWKPFKWIEDEPVRKSTRIRNEPNEFIPGHTI